MQTTSNLSFKSNIYFISARKFKKLPKDDYITAIIQPFVGCPPYKQAQNILSREIRTCTGGALTGKSKAVGFHVYHDAQDYNNLNKTIFEILKLGKNNQNALLIGSKECSETPYSVSIFKKMKNSLSKVVKNLTFFETHKNQNAQSHIYYNSHNDSWYIASTFIDSKKDCKRPILSLQELLDKFENVQIAPGDRLFIRGREILPSDCPQIFQSVIK